MPHIVVGAVIGFFLLAFVNKFELSEVPATTSASFAADATCVAPWVYYVALVCRRRTYCVRSLWAWQVGFRGKDGQRHETDEIESGLLHM